MRSQDNVTGAECDKRGARGVGATEGAPSDAQSDFGAVRRTWTGLWRTNGQNPTTPGSRRDETHGVPSAMDILRVGVRKMLASVAIIDA